MLPASGPGTRRQTRNAAQTVGLSREASEAELGSSRQVIITGGADEALPWGKFPKASVRSKKDLLGKCPSSCVYKPP